jgi:Fe-S-cluster-containing hydrogenase component 2
LIRKIVSIDKNKCNGCGLCVSACHEGAIGIVEGHAALLHDELCDGLGSCLPVCPTGAITITLSEKKATGCDDIGVNNIENRQPALSCDGTHLNTIEYENNREETQVQVTLVKTNFCQWPVQIKLVPPNAQFFNNANLLVAADCTAYAYSNFHEYMKDKITIIGCPKLDDENYCEKLSVILRINDIKSVTVTRMEVPCCSGIENAAKSALKKSGKLIPCEIVVFSTNGNVLRK